MFMEDNFDFPVDLIYLWVDGNDPLWRAKKNAFISTGTRDTGKDCEGRYVDNEELKYSLRSVEKFAPWIRKIFIVTDSQTPLWLDIANPKIKIIDHKELLPEAALPCFNSRIIEHNLFKIKGLAENFLYANDDMFFGKCVSPNDFFLADGRPIVRFNRRPMRKLSLWLEKNIIKKKVSNYKRAIQNTAELMEKRYGKYIGHKTHHNIDAYKKSDYQATYELFKEDIEPTLINHLRADNDIQRNIYSYVPILEKRAKVKFVNQKESFRCHIDNEGNFLKLEKSNPKFFCLNDSEFADYNDRKRVKEFLEKRFPEKSQFEKNVDGK